jgi:hypothetical protein
MDEIHSDDARRIIPFYQDQEGYLCCQLVHFWRVRKRQW